MIINRPVLALTACLLSCTSPLGYDNTMQEPVVMVFCSLHGPSAASVGEAVNVRFTLSNHSHQQLYVLRWYTPLEGIRGKIFQVTRGGQEIAYRGPLVRRGNPVREDYLEIEPGRQVSAVVDLTSAYNLSKTGTYRVEFVSKLHDVATDEGSIPRQIDEFQPLKLICEPRSLDIVVE